MTQEDTDRALKKKLDMLEVRISAEHLEQGWTKLDDGNWIPPGWVRAEAPAALAWPDNRAEQKHDSV